MIKFKHAIIAIVVFIGQFAYSQTSTVSGIVSDDTGIPLPGATIVISGTTVGTTTDFDGKFTLPDVPSNASLIITYLGYEKMTIPLNGRTSINVSLVQDLEALEEVVVVGYGTQSRSEVTGAISTIKSEDITAIPVTNEQ